MATTELGLNLVAGTILGYTEYPSHYLNGLDSPVGLAFRCPVAEDQLTEEAGGRR